VKQRLQLLLDAKMTIDEALQIRHANISEALKISIILLSH
jgi:hypothetical protein